jgi:preprotein translocase subunit YajC
MDFIPLALAGAMIVFMIMSSNKRKRQAAEMTTRVLPGAKVMLTSGIYGRVTKIDGDRLVIETTPGTSLSVIKLAVREVVKTDVESPVTKTTKKAEKPAAASAAEPVKKTTVKKTAK